MNPELAHRAEDILYDLLGVDPAQREPALREACGGDASLLSEVRSLLRAHREPSAFMDTARARELASQAQAAPLSNGERVAGYTIRGIMGMGGMGVVYVADQDRPRRTVALKVIRRGFATEAIVRRFEHEAEVLGLLQHPGIAQIHEAGIANVVHQGPTPFIAMELVKGRPLGDHAKAHGLDLRQRLDLMARVCDAVDHAHQRGVIHRDLKPGNILVDEQGQPKVLDFGVARAVSGDLHAMTMQTGVGQLIGTLQYMSPEQIRADPAHIDHRSDVYALGVILFELLLGRHPHELTGLPLPEAARRICDDDPQVAGWLDRSLRGDVEIIIAKSLEKDAAHRYQSAAELAADIRRHLEGRPISARDDSTLYVLRRRLRRYHSTLTVAGVSIVALSGIAAFALVQSNLNKRLARSESAAKTEALESLKAAKDSRQVADATAARLREELAVSNTERGRLFGRTGNLAAAEDQIWPEHLRNPAGRSTLWALRELYSRQPCLATLLAHEGVVQAMVLSADAGILYTCAEDQTVKAWDLKTMSCVRTLRGHHGSVTCLSLARDEHTLASGSLDGSIIVFDLVSAEARYVIDKAHAGGVRTIAISPDGTKLASGGEDNALRLWDAQSGAPLLAMPAECRNAISRLAWTPNGKWIVSGTNWPESSLRLWDGAQSVRTLASHGLGISSIAFSRDGAMMATGGGDRQIRLWETETWKEQHKLLAPNGTVYSLGFTADGKRLMSTGWWTADVWDLESRQRMRSFSLRAGAVCGACSADGSLLITGTGDGTLKMWDVTPDAGLLRLHAHPFGRTACALSPDARIIATGGVDGMLKLWDRRDGGLLAAIHAHNLPVRTIKFSPDGSFVATGAEDYLAKLWDLRTGQLVGTIEQYLGITNDSLDFNADGRLLAAIRTDWTVSIHSIPDLAEKRRIPKSAAQTISVRFGSTSDELAVVARDRAIHLWPASGDTPQVLSSEIAEWTTAFSPDGSKLISGNWAKNVHLWDLRTRERLQVFEGHGGLPAAVAFDLADPSVIASAGADGAVRLWDIPTGRTLAMLDAFDGWEAQSLSLSADGRWLLSSGANGIAAVWDLLFFDRFIAGNLAFQLSRNPNTPADSTTAVRQWAKTLLTDKRDDDAPLRPGVSPEAIAMWRDRTRTERGDAAPPGR